MWLQRVGRARAAGRCRLFRPLLVEGAGIAQRLADLPALIPKHVRAPATDPHGQVRYSVWVAEANELLNLDRPAPGHPHDRR